MQTLLVVVLVITFHHTCKACTTLVVGRGATINGSVMAAHSNDGQGNVAGNLNRVAAADWPANSMRRVNIGSIPQINHTYAYFTKAGGYASINEYQVGLAESTCNAIFSASSGQLNIVDLSALALERSNTARMAINVMGTLAEKYGYKDAGESLMVIDKDEAFVFHILPIDTGVGAIWVAQLVPDDHVGVVANSFTVRTVNFNDSHSFLASKNMRKIAQQHGFWKPGEPFDFTRIFSGKEMGHKYSCGRRMWIAYSLLAPSVILSPIYGDLVYDSPYPTTVPVLPSRKLNLTNLIQVMRNSYQGTAYDMTKGLAAGAFGTPDRWAAGIGESEVKGNWERSIATSRSIVSYILEARTWLPNAIGGILWFAPHAAHTSCYVPFPVGMDMLPSAYSNNDLNRVDRGKGAVQANRFVFNIAQLKFSYMIVDINALQHKHETESLQLQSDMDKKYHDPSDMASITAAYEANANNIVTTWWKLADNLLLHYADGYCNGCGHGLPRNLGYPAWWLRSVNYSTAPTSKHNTSKTDQMFFYVSDVDTNGVLSLEEFQIALRMYDKQLGIVGS